MSSKFAVPGTPRCCPWHRVCLPQRALPVLGERGSGPDKAHLGAGSAVLAPLPVLQCAVGIVPEETAATAAARG